MEKKTLKESKFEVLNGFLLVINQNKSSYVIVISSANTMHGKINQIAGFRNAFRTYSNI